MVLGLESVTVMAGSSGCGVASENVGHSSKRKRSGRKPMYPGKQAALHANRPAVVMAGCAQQSARASSAPARTEAARPLLDLHGEPCALCRMLRGGPAGRPLLHL